MVFKPDLFLPSFSLSFFLLLLLAVPIVNFVLNTSHTIKLLLYHKQNLHEGKYKKKLVRIVIRLGVFISIYDAGPAPTRSFNYLWGSFVLLSISKINALGTYYILWYLYTILHRQIFSHPKLFT